MGGGRQRGAPVCHPCGPHRRQSRQRQHPASRRCTEVAAEARTPCFALRTKGHSKHGISSPAAPRPPAIRARPSRVCCHYILADLTPAEGLSKAVQTLNKIFCMNVCEKRRSQATIQREACYGPFMKHAKSGNAPPMSSAQSAHGVQKAPGTYGETARPRCSRRRCATRGWPNTPRALCGRP